MSGRLRIIGGQWRSRIIHFEDAPGLRPTPARLRETLFNWLLLDVQGSACLDLFAGSGALGFEAASRGALRVVQVESNPKVCERLRQNKANLQANQVDVVMRDVDVFLGRYFGESFDLVFMDPPFAKALLPEACRQLDLSGCLGQHAKIYVEAERTLKILDVPENWFLIRNSSAGDVSCFLYQRG